MHTPTLNTATPDATDGVLTRVRRVLLRKLWLPRALYEILPYVYVLAGIAALTAALYLPGWTWILPYLVLIGLICLHAGVAIVALRVRFRRSRDRGSSS